MDAIYKEMSPKMSDSAQENELQVNSGALQAIPEGDFETVSTVSTANKGGRPTLYTPETINKLLTSLADGLTIKQACKAGGVSESTLSDWRERYPDLEPRLVEAREHARQKALANIKAAGESGDWRASEAFLRMSFAADYRRDANINVNATATAQQGVVLTEEKRRELQERLARLQAGMDSEKDNEANERSA
jgi:hypothetical protein